MHLIISTPLPDMDVIDEELNKNTVTVGKNLADKKIFKDINMILFLYAGGECIWLSLTPLLDIHNNNQKQKVWYQPRCLSILLKPKVI